MAGIFLESEHLENTLPQHQSANKTLPAKPETSNPLHNNAAVRGGRVSQPHVCTTTDTCWKVDTIALVPKKRKPYTGALSAGGGLVSAPCLSFLAYTGALSAGGGLVSAPCNCAILENKQQRWAVPRPPATLQRQSSHLLARQPNSNRTMQLCLHKAG